MLYPFTLFLHIVGALGLFAVLALEWMSLYQLRRVASAEQAREWLKVFTLFRRLYPFIWATILLSGLYMTALVWHWVAWIVVALAAILLIAGIGAALSGRRMAAIGPALFRENGNLSPSLRQLLRDPLLWVSIQTRVALGLGIIFLMVVKPGLAGALLAIAAAAVLGLAASLPAWGREQSNEAAARPGA